MKGLRILALRRLNAPHVGEGFGFEIIEGVLVRALQQLRKVLILTLLSGLRILLEALNLEPCGRLHSSLIDLEV